MRTEKRFYVKRYFLPFSCSFEKQDLMFRTTQCVRFRKKFIHGVRFRIKHLKTCQKLRKVCIQKVTLSIMLLRENDFFFAFSLLFRNAWIKKKISMHQSFVTEFERVCFRKILFWITLDNKIDLFDLSCITLKSLFLHKQFKDASDFQIKK